MASAVLDANVVIGLVKGGVFQHLADLYSPLYVPPTVRQEITAQTPPRPGTVELAQALGQWITEATPDPAALQQFTSVGAIADREVLALAKERAVDHVLSGDRVVRREAQSLGLVVLSASLVVVLMKGQGLIAAVKPVLDQMEQSGFGISAADYRQAILAAGEQP